MTGLTKDEMKSAIKEALVEHLDPKSHKEHHDFIEAMVQKEQRKQEMWQKVKTQVVGWGVIAVIGSIGAYVINHIPHFFSR